MAKAFIRFDNVKSYSEKHNIRSTDDPKKQAKYLIENKKEDNVIYSEKSIKETKEELKEIYEKEVKQKMQKKTCVVKEAVVLLPNGNNIENIEKIEKLINEIEEKHKIKAFQFYIHNDEGWKDPKTEKIKRNYHAHILFEWIDRKTGKSIKLQAKELREIQTLTAECLEMERGKEGSKSLHLNHKEYRIFKKVTKEMKMNKEQETEMRLKIKRQRDKGSGMEI